MTFTNKLTPVTFEYSLDNSILEQCKTFKDLGIVYDQKLSFNNHIETVTASSMRMLGFITRVCRDFTGVDAQKTLFISYVRSKLEYCAIIWCPYYNTYINQLESIQRKFLKNLAFHCDHIYPARGIDQNILLKRFDMPTLTQRRQFLSLQFLYKIYNNIIDCSELMTSLNIQVAPVNTRHHNYFFIPRNNTNVLAKAPIPSMCKLYNKLADKLDISYMNPTEFRTDTKKLIFTD
jgi:hypothetical protein